MMRIASLLLAAIIAFTVTVATGLAQQGSGVLTPGQSQSTAPRAFLPPAAAKPNAAPAAEQGVTGRLYAWVTSLQGEYNQRLARAVRELRTGNPLLATLAIAGLSFMYGVLHAVGPGHGKAVISSYVLANERTVRRGIALSFLAAVFQAIAALVLVFVLVGVLNATGVTRKATEAWLETVSWGLVAAIGAWLFISQVRKLWPRKVAGHTHELHDHAHGHSHTGNAATDSAACCGHDHHDAHDGKRPEGGHADGHRHLAHDHSAHAHDHADCCGHAHMPDPRQLEGKWSWRKALPIALAIGIRPCTGAIAVLVFAISQGLLWAGVFATFAMALGTAITVSALAVIAVGSRDLAAWFGGEDSGWGRRVRVAAALCGSLAVMVLGAMLFIGSLSPNSASIF